MAAPRSLYLLLAAYVTLSSLIPVILTEGDLSSPLQPSDSSGFVKAQGTKLVLDGKCFYFQGSNSILLGPVNDQELTLEYTIGVMKAHRAAGTTVIRTWAFAKPCFFYFERNNTVFMHESAMVKLDVVVAAARQVGIKLILVLINYYDAAIGIQYFVDVAHGPWKEQEIFFASSQTWAMYQSHVTSIITRVNNITGVKYSEEPAIMAWEVMNEPHTSDNFELQNDGMLLGDLEFPIRSRHVGALVAHWICKAATFIKSLDSNHLVTTGEEGYRARGATDPRYNWSYWINNGWKGGDFFRNTQCASIDLMTVHVYPDNWEIPFDSFKWTTEVYMKDRRDIAHAAGKPIILEEYGCCKDASYKGKRAEVMRAFHEAVQKLDYAGSMPWQVMTDDLWLKYDTDYSFTYSTVDGGEEVTRNAKAFAEKAAQCKL